MGKACQRGDTRRFRGKTGLAQEVGAHYRNCHTADTQDEGMAWLEGGYPTQKHA